MYTDCEIMSQSKTDAEKVNAVRSISPSASSVRLEKCGQSCSAYSLTTLLNVPPSPLWQRIVLYVVCIR